MATWAEPFGGWLFVRNTHFPQDWTIFTGHGGWYLHQVWVYLAARISRGRTIKQMVSGSIFFGSLGCFYSS
ncbi:BCCT family transporter [Vibrio chagasii]|nr:BCCT family transporter [Vibrio chagasii]